MTQFANDSILPLPPDLEVLHDREYRVQAYRKSDDLILIRGAVRDQKPPGLYLGDDDQPLTIHHMQIDLEVSFPMMEILAAEVRFVSFPNDICPDIVEHYDNLVGLSIARGFTHKVRELFGGPKACTHTTALLQAMAPVAIQCVWSMRASQARRAGAAAVAAGEAPPSPVPATAEQRKAMWQMNINSCHVWAQDSEYVTELEQGAPMPAPVFIRGRMAKLGIDPSEWSTRMWA